MFEMKTHRQKIICVINVIVTRKKIATQLIDWAKNIFIRSLNRLIRKKHCFLYFVIIAKDINQNGNHDSWFLILRVQVQASTFRISYSTSSLR